MSNHRTPRGQADQGPPNAILSTPGKRTIAKRVERSPGYLFAVEQRDKSYRLLSEGKWSRHRASSVEELRAMGFPWVAPLSAQTFEYADRELAEWLASARASLRLFSDVELAGYAAGLAWVVGSTASNLRKVGHRHIAEELRESLVKRLTLVVDEPVGFLLWFSGFRLSFDLLPLDTVPEVREALGHLAFRSDDVSVQLIAAGYGQAIPLTEDLAHELGQPAPCTATLVDMGVVLREEGLSKHRAFQFTLSSVLPRIDRAGEWFDLFWNRYLCEFFRAHVPDMQISLDAFDANSYPYRPLTTREHQAFHEWLDAQGKPFAQHCCPGVTGRDPTTRWVQDCEPDPTTPRTLSELVEEYEGRTHGQRR